MILFRALNKDDQVNYLNGGHIYCSLQNASRDKNMRKVSKYFDTYYDLCLNKERQYALDSIIGHISGKRLMKNISPWVSLSSDYNFVMEEYAVPQSGNYNFERDRKPILVVNVDDKDIYNDSNKIANLRNTYKDNIIIDLRNGLLKEYYENDAVLSEKFNENMPGYDFLADLSKEFLGRHTRVDGFANYTSASSELLAFGEISKKYDRFVLYPLLQDIIYGSTKDVDSMIIFMRKKLSIIKNTVERLYLSLGSFYIDLYPGVYAGTNLTDYLIVNYDKVPGDSIEEKYENLKIRKINLLNIICQEINNVLKSDIHVNKVVDDKVLVSSYENLSTIPVTLRHDIILIEKDNKLYPYDNTSHTYISSNDELTKKDVYKLMKSKKMK